MKRPPRFSTAALWRWRLRHPLDAIRAAAPRFLSLDTRLRLLRAIRPLRRPPRAAGRSRLIAGFASELAELPESPRHRPGGALVSILIVTYNNLELTRLCIESVLKLTESALFEIIVVDNASSDGTAEWLAGQPRLRLIPNVENRGFPAAANQAAAAANGEIFCFLNNDTVVTPHWLRNLQRHLGERSIGLVGASTNAIGNEARVGVRYSSLREMLAVAEELENDRSLMPLPTVAFFCVALRREVWERVGPLDERFGIGMFEDDDYCRRVRETGLATVCARDVFVHHWQMASFSLLDNAEYLRIYRENERKFREKWRGA